MELESLNFVIKIVFNIKSRATDKLKPFYQWITKFQSLQSETLVIPDCRCLKMCTFDMMHLNLKLKEDNVLHKFPHLRMNEFE